MLTNRPPSPALVALMGSADRERKRVSVAAAVALERVAAVLPLEAQVIREYITATNQEAGYYRIQMRQSEKDREVGA